MPSYFEMERNGIRYDDTFCCGYCEHLSFDVKDNKRSEDLYKCLVRKDKKNKDKQLEVSLFKHDDIRDCYDITSTLYHNERWHRMWCEFIATIICMYAGIGINSPEMETLRWFRANIMEKDYEYHKLINDYKYVGKLIAYKLINRFSEYNTAHSYFVSYIKPVVNLIEKGRQYNQSQKSSSYYREAIDIYSSMILLLQREFVTFIIGDNYNNPEGLNYTWNNHK